MTKHSKLPPSVTEEDLLRIVLERGLITREDLDMAEAVTRDQKGEETLYGPRIHALLESQRLNEKSLHTILEEFQTVIIPPTPPSAEDLESQPTIFGSATTQPGSSGEKGEPERCGRFEILDFIGEGGMGRVYKAHDPKLNRTVALKFLHAGTPEAEKKFLQEARQQARVEHSHICKVYEVGEEDGKPYIAMQFIEGEELKSAAKEMSIEERVSVMIKVAEAVHAAHRNGLIHRDLKPGNIMVARTEEGWFPFVLDFGLSREMEAPSMSQSGVIAGTPHYMAPEQVKGKTDQMDRRTDVYALGATLYEIMGGAPPFTGISTMDVLMDVLHKESESLRKANPSFPKDLDTIIVKCLEKEPSRRYDSAKALAKDLERFLDGDPIEARRSGLAYRVSKKVRKYKLLSGLIAALVLLVVAFSGYELHKRHVSAVTAHYNEEFSQDVDYMEKVLHNAYTTPLHDVRKEEDLVRDRLKDVEKRSASYGKYAVGPAGYALGKGYLALDETKRALENLRKAWDSGDKRPEVAYALGLALGKRYEEELGKLGQIKDKNLREMKRKEIEKSYRLPAKDFIRRSRGIEVASADYIEGLIALYDKDYDEAIEKAEKAVERVPWLYEGHLLKARALDAIATRQRNGGKYEEASETYDRVEKSLDDALKIGESDPDTREQISRLWFRRLEMAMNNKLGDPNEIEVKALNACSNLLVARPDSLKGHLLLSGIWILKGKYVMESRGLDPLPQFQKAEEIALEISKRYPRNPSPYVTLSRIYQLRAEYERVHGMPVMESLDRSVENLKKVIALTPSNIYLYTNLGNTFLRRARELRDRGEEYHKTLLDAVDAYKIALASHETTNTISNLGLTYADLARYENAHGNDPTEMIDKSIEMNKKALARNSRDFRGYYGISVGYRMKAQYEMEEGKDPTGSLNLAIENMEKAIAIRPTCFSCYNSLGNAYIYLGNYRMDRGEDPMEAYASGAQCYEKTIRLKPDFVFAYNNLGEINLQQGIYTIHAGKDPGSYLSAAVKSLEKSISINTKRATPYFILGVVYRTMGEYAVKRGADPSRYFKESLATFRRGLKINPKIAQAHLDVAKLHLANARYRKERKRSPDSAIEPRFRKGGRSEAQKSPPDMAKHSDDRRWRSHPYGEEEGASRAIDGGNFQVAVDHTCEIWVESGIDAVDQSLQLNPRNAEAHLIRGQLLLLRAQITLKKEAAKAAGESFRKAVAINKTFKKQIDPLLAEAQRLSKSST